VKDDTMMLTPNGTADRLRYIAKTYASKPLIVIDMIDIIALTVGEDNWVRKVFAAAKADPAFDHDVRQWGLRGLTVEPPAAYVSALVATVSALPGLSRATPADPLFPWMATQLAREVKKTKPPYDASNSGDYYVHLDEFRSKGTMLAQWFVDTKPNLTKLDAADVLNEAYEWALEREEGEKAQKQQGEVVHTFKDGYTVQKLTTEKQLEAEGDVMQHCVGGYYDEVRRGKTEIYSIRDPKGRPHVTIEFDPKALRVKQVQGKQNAEPAPKYQPYVEEFTETLPKHPAHIRAIMDALDQYDTGITDDDEGLADIAREWNSEGFDAIDVGAWCQIGVTSSSEASTLNSENITPEELKSWPNQIRDKFWGDQGISGLKYDDVEWLAKLARMVMKLRELDERRPPKPPQGAFAFVEAKKKRRHTDRGDDYYSMHGSSERWRTAWNKAGDAWLDEAEEADGWLDAGFDPTDVEPWFIAHFTPKQAERWATDIGADVDVAIELRARGVSPSQVEDAVQSDRLADEDIDYRTKARKPPVRDTVSKVLSALGLEQNRRRAR
jgi:hypothetical protein